MERFLKRLFDTSRYTSRLDRDRAQVVYVISSVLLLLMTGFVTVSPLSGRLAWDDNAIDTNVFSLLFVTAYCMLFASIVLTRRGQVTIGGTLLTVIVSLFLGAFVVGSGGYTITDGMAVLVVVAFCSLMLPHYGLYVGVAIAVFMVYLAVNQRVMVPLVPANDGYDLIVSFILIGLSAALFYVFLRFARISRLEGAISANQARLKLAQITTEISQRISRRLALKDVLNSAVEDIRTSYPAIYHAQIFLIDDTRQNAALVASTGEVGKLLIERQHALAVGGQSVIGQVTARQRPIIARANSSDGVHRRNEFLPDTAVEAAFPLLIGDVVIGALDLQSRTSETIENDDIPIFQALADNIAIAIDNARLFEVTERRLQENQQLVAQAQQATAEVERLNQRLTRRFWEDYLTHDNSAPGLHVDLVEQEVHPDTAWTPAIQQAIQRNSAVQDSQIVAVPLRVRGQAVGAMEFELNDVNSLSPEDIAMIEEVSEQLGLAAESNRLFETSQRMAQREALVNEIATRLQNTSSVEMTLTTAARSLKETLNANKVVIRLGMPPAREENGKSV
ncbi:MAG: GAF domain-containing protein [Anaerolineae bacterium]